MTETASSNRLFDVLEAWFLIFLITVIDLAVAFMVWHLVSSLLDFVMGPAG